MIHSEAAHPNCMYMWMNHIASAEANAQATVWFGEAPTSDAACEAAEAISPGHCDTFHATDEAYFENVWYWSTPQATAPMPMTQRSAWTGTAGWRRGRASSAADPLTA